MQSHLIYSLITKGKIVISVILTVTVLCSCRKEKQTVFTDTVYSSGGSGYSVSGGSGEEEPSGAESTADAEREPDRSDISEENTEDSGSTICVFVCGAVNSEGVYELPGNARAIDAVEAAGGYSDDADRAYVNQAEYVYDTQRVEIPTLEEAQELREAASSGAGAQGQAGAQQDDGLIDINTADMQELMKMPGIGESKAERIIEYRQLHGRFGSTEELMNVSGIGSGMYEKMKDCITVK